MLTLQLDFVQHELSDFTAISVGDAQTLDAALTQTLGPPRLHFERPPRLIFPSTFSSFLLDIPRLFGTSPSHSILALCTSRHEQTRCSARDPWSCWRWYLLRRASPPDLHLLALGEREMSA